MNYLGMRIFRILLCSSHRIHCGASQCVLRTPYILNLAGYRRISLLAASHNIYSVRYVSCSPLLRDRPADDVPSRVEQSLKILREELQQQQEKKEQLEAEMRNGKVRLVHTSDPDEKKEKEPPKKTLIVRVKDEILHYYHGFRLLFIEMGIACRLVLRLVRGSVLSRRERRQLTRTTADIFRMVPFLVFIVIPFMELALPIYLKFFPNALPSTFQDSSKQDEKIRRQLKVKLEMAKFMQATIEQLSLEKKSADASPMAIDFANFMRKIREEGGYVPNSELLKYSKLFEDELTLDNLPIDLLRAMCRIVGILPVGPPNILRFQLTMKLRELKADDQLITQEGGVKSLTVPELQAANRARGMRALGLSEQRLRSNLKQWLELSMNDQVPPSLLLLSRTLYMSEEVSFTDRLKALIGQLPETMDKETRLKLSEMESGKVDNKARLELIKNIEETLKKERKVLKDAKVSDEKKKKAEGEAADALKQKELLGNVEKAETIEQEIIDVLPMEDTAFKLDIPKEREAKTKDKVEISYKEDLSDLEHVLHNVTGQLHEEKEDLQDLKEQVQEHKVDVDSVKLIVKEVGGEANESKAARLLQSRVDKLISTASKVLDKVMDQKLTIKGEPDNERKKEKLVSINELLLNLRKLQKVPDDTKVQRVGEVLKTLDEDHDGNVDVYTALQVIELMGTDNVKIETKQMANILAMLKKEDELQDAIDSEMYIAKHHGKTPPPPPTRIPNVQRNSEVISEYSDKIQSGVKPNESNSKKQLR